ncbi:MAG: hypothetical protein JWM98_1826 [Thermoleophilia bacterium]|nr:hypothetical protein [Thermoleophilia bacterium]
MGSVDAVVVVHASASQLRRRRSAHPALAAAPLAPPPAVQPVPGTAAAEAAKDAAHAAAGRRPHILLDPDLASRPAEAKVRMPADMSPVEIADRIVAVLLQGSGPILLCCPGTLGGTYETSMLSAARAFVAAADGPVSVASIPYPNGITDVVTRFFHIGTGAATNTLALVLDRLRRLAPGRPILLTGESQGAWLIADTLRADPVLAAAVTRIALFAKPGFVAMPSSIGAAHMGVELLAPTAREAGVVEWRHTDDIVPSLFARLGTDVALGYVTAIKGWRQTGEFEYVPHHYDAHGAEAAQWLLHAVRPTLPTVHHSSADHPAAPAPAA